MRTARSATIHSNQWGNPRLAGDAAFYGYRHSRMAGIGRIRSPRRRWDTEGFAYQYASSTQSLSIARCHWVSFHIQEGQTDLTDTEPAYSPPSTHLLYP